MFDSPKKRKGLLIKFSCPHLVKHPNVLTQQQQQHIKEEISKGIEPHGPHKSIKHTQKLFT